jgi:POT family proton-dependent oligopeptide transporter
LFFWTLYDQTGSSWVHQLKRLDCNMFGQEFLPAQVQAVNPLLVMIYIPLFNFVLYPWLNRRFALTPLRKIGIGFALTAAAFGISWLIEILIENGNAAAAGELQQRIMSGTGVSPEETAAIFLKHRPSAFWQVLAYIVITAGEVMVSITGLEYSYSQAPNKLKSVVMSFYLLTVSLGNVLTAMINKVIADDQGNIRIAYSSYFAFFTFLMIAALVAYTYFSRSFSEKTYFQGDDAAPTPDT